uniref:Uncharacterized protein n=1 Tax=Rhizophora mucronata TaxID=61149 RepID=A0A2P2R557_RHIMU
MFPMHKALSHYDVWKRSNVHSPTLVSHKEAISTI